MRFGAVRGGGIKILSLSALVNVESCVSVAELEVATADVKSENGSCLSPIVDEMFSPSKFEVIESDKNGDEEPTSVSCG